MITILNTRSMKCHRFHFSVEFRSQTQKTKLSAVFPENIKLIFNVMHSRCCCWSGVFLLKAFRPPSAAAEPTLSVCKPEDEFIFNLLQKTQPLTPEQSHPRSYPHLPPTSFPSETLSNTELPFLISGDDNSSGNQK